jgi:hypothetical protein
MIAHAIWKCDIYFPKNTNIYHIFGRGIYKNPGDIRLCAALQKTKSYGIFDVQTNSEVLPMFRSSYFGSRRDYPNSLSEIFRRFLRKLMAIALLLGLAYFCAANSDTVLSIFRLFVQFLRTVLIELVQA